MSLIRSCLIISAAIMFLPVEEKKQIEFTQTLAATPEQSATYCERNPSTCQAGRELWSTFVRKAEYATELGARLLREQLVRAMTEPHEPGRAVQQPLALVPFAQAGHPQPVRYEPVPPPIRPDHQPAARRQGYPMDNASRWRGLEVR